MRIKDDDKTWLQWYWLEFGDWVHLHEAQLTTLAAWLVAIGLICIAVSRWL